MIMRDRLVFFMKEAAYDVRISDWMSDVCSSDPPWKGRFSGVFVLASAFLYDPRALPANAGNLSGKPGTGIAKATNRAGAMNRDGGLDKKDRWPRKICWNSKVPLSSCCPT